MVVVTADDDLCAGKAFAQPPCDLDQIAGVERADNSVTGLLMQRHARGKALAQQQRLRHLANPVRPTGDLAPLQEALGAIGCEELERGQRFAVVYRYHEVVIAIHAHTVGLNRLPGQIGVILGRFRLVPDALGLLGGFCTVCLASSPGLLSSGPYFCKPLFLVGVPVFVPPRQLEAGGKVPENATLAVLE